MSRKPLGFKPTLRQQKEQVNTALRWMATMSGKPIPEGVLNTIAPKRERAAPVQREAPVVAAIAELLAVHPKVLFAVRQNSGMASYEAKSGRYAPVFFYRIITSQPVTIPDFWGILRDGRMFACEAKAPGWKHPSGDREMRQAAFLAMVRNCGGVALFAWEASMVADAMELQ